MNERGTAAVELALILPMVLLLVLALAEDVGVHVVRPHVVGQQAAVSVTSRRQVAGRLFGGFAVELHAKAVMRVEQ